MTGSYNVKNVRAEMTFLQNNRCAGPTVRKYAMTIPSNPTVIKTIFRLVFMESKHAKTLNIA